MIVSKLTGGIDMIALITGCSSGIGRTLCKKMKENGYTVIATARKSETLKTLEADSKLELDVTDESSIQKAAEFVQEKYGKIDILVNNAGYSKRGALEEIPMADVSRLFDVNVFGIMRMIQAFAPMMRKEGNGKIINIGSISGRFTQAANGSYCATKHAVEAISEAAGYELSSYKIQVSVLEPGPMETEFFHTLEQNSDGIMQNQNSPYFSIYQQNQKVREKQKRCSADAAADEIFRICKKKKLKKRYFVAVPFLYRVAISLKK